MLVRYAAASMRVNHSAAVSVIVFVLIQLPPGDFADTRIAQLEMQGTSGNDQLAADLRKNFHLDEPIAKRYVRESRLRGAVSRAKIKS